MEKEPTTILATKDPNSSITIYNIAGACMDKAYTMDFRSLHLKRDDIDLLNWMLEARGNHAGYEYSNCTLTLHFSRPVIEDDVRFITGFMVEKKAITAEIGDAYIKEFRLNKELEKVAFQKAMSRR